MLPDEGGGLLLALCTMIATERSPRFPRSVGCPPDACRRLVSVASLGAIQPARKGCGLRIPAGQRSSDRYGWWPRAALNTMAGVV